MILLLTRCRSELSNMVLAEMSNIEGNDQLR